MSPPSSLHPPPPLSPSRSRSTSASWQPQLARLARSAGLALLGALLLAASPAAALPARAGTEVSIRSVSPPGGTRGTELTITGSGFGEKRPRVFLRPADGGKQRKLKVLEWSDVQIKARVRKALAGVHTVVVRPRLKTSGGGEAVLPDGFEVLPPHELMVGETCVQPSQDVSLSGKDFGTKKGKVFVDGRKAKVISWTVGGAAGDQVVFRVPGGNVSGTVGIEIRTPVGSATLEDALLVLDSSDLGFTADFDAVAFDADLAGAATLVEVAGGQTHVLVADSAGDSVEFRLRYDPALDGPQTIAGLDILQFHWQHDGKLWVLDVDAMLQSSVTIEVDPHCAGVLLGSFSGFLSERFGRGTVDVANGTFQVPLDR